jgi:hypothetical protein
MTEAQELIGNAMQEIHSVNREKKTWKDAEDDFLNNGRNIELSRATNINLRHVWQMADYMAYAYALY